MTARHYDITWMSRDKLRDFHKRKLSVLQSGRDVIDLSMINPDLPPPRILLDRLMEACAKPANHRYAVSRGIRKLREAFAVKYKSRFNVNLNPEEEICVTFGARDALQQTLSILHHPNRKVLLGRPYYPGHLYALQFMQSDLVFFDISEDPDHMLGQISTLVNTDNIGLILLNFPNNPNGITVSSDFYSSLAEIIRGKNCYVINDFVYGEMIFNGQPATSILANDALREKAVEFYSLSKAYSIPGWRVAAALGPASIVNMISQLKSHIDYGLFLPLQLASAHALLAEEKIVQNTVVHYAERARLLAELLSLQGWRVLKPQGGCSLWARLPDSLRGYCSASRFTINLLESEGVAVLPGSLFGAPDDDSARFALVSDTTSLREVAQRISNLTERITK
ncbi:MAG: pyridoxal phosphate-dependent aminotransferase [Candidatus Dadabacteria bacterium]|nr:MAG: pyridoxal phosphate-dependent aminotransferase [Candidatus Dadabacteria bacterium]